MVRTRRKKSSEKSMIPSLGFFGGVGAHVGCSSDNTSFFCQLTKITSILTQIIFIGIVCYLIYFFIIKPYLLK